MNSTNIHINNVHIAVAQYTPKKPLKYLNGDASHLAQKSPLLINADDSLPTFQAHARITFPINVSKETMKDRLKTKPIYFVLIDNETSAQVALFKVDDIGDIYAPPEKAHSVNVTFPPVPIKEQGTFRYTITQLPPADGSDYNKKSFRIDVTRWYDKSKGVWKTDVSYPAGEPEFFYVSWDDSMPPKPNVSATSCMFTASARVIPHYWTGIKQCGDCNDLLKNHPLIFQLVDDEKTEQVSICKVDHIEYNNPQPFFYTHFPIPTPITFPPIVNLGTHHYTMSQVPPADGCMYDDKKYGITVRTNINSQTPIVTYDQDVKVPYFDYYCQ